MIPPFKLKHSQQKYMSFGGFPLAQLLLARENLPVTLDSGLPRPAPQATYSSSDVVLSLLFTVLMGGEGLEDVNHSRHELAQVKGFKASSADTVIRRLKEWKEKNTEHFSGTEGRVNNTYNFATDLNKLLKKIAAKCLPPKRRGGYRLDVDAHILENEKKDARPTYNHKLGYAPLGGFVERCPVEIEMRGGNTAPGTGILAFTKRAIKGLGEEGVRITEVCSDAAGYNFEFMEWLHKKRLRFYIRAKRCASMLQHVGQLEDWHPVHNKKGDLLYEWAETEWKGYRLIVQRVEKDNGQVDLESATPYRYQAIITNDSRKKSDGLSIINYYNKRGGSERNFDYLRNDFGWRKLPFDNMAENTVYLLVMALIANIFEWLKIKISSLSSLLGSTAVRVKNFLLRFAAVPARWSRSGRETILRLFTDRDYSALLTPR